MAVTTTQVNDYLNSIQVVISNYTNDVCIKERLGNSNILCNRIKVVLLSACLDCIVGYFTPFLNGEEVTYEDNNFFTTEEILDIIQHINSICDSFYTLDI
jgi:hypothetical protein